MVSSVMQELQHELQLGQRPLQALSQQQRATFHWLLLTLPEDLTAHAELESLSQPTPIPYGDPLAGWLAEARPAHTLALADHHYEDANQQAEAVAAGDLCQARLIQVLRPQPLMARLLDHPALDADVTANLAPWLAARVAGGKSQMLGALNAAIELAEHHYAA